jgi:vacuolar-type H+-ATPase subunit E/Vma4
MHVVVAIAVAVVVAADVANHKVKAQIHKRALMMSHRIQPRIQKKAPREQLIAVAVAAVQPVMMSLQVKSLMKMA